MPDAPRLADLVLEGGGLGFIGPVVDGFSNAFEGGILPRWPTFGVRLSSRAAGDFLAGWDFPGWLTSCTVVVVPAGALE